MTDSSSEFQNDSELKFSCEQGFFDKNLGVRFIIGLIFLLSLFSVLHFREVRVEVPELNSAAIRYVVAQTDIVFQDDEATKILRQEAIRDLGMIYKISDRDIRSRRTDFENFLVTDEQWRADVEGGNLNEMYFATDLMEKALLKLRFTDSRTLRKMNQVNLPTMDYLVFTPRNLEEPVSFPYQIWMSIGQLAFTDEPVTKEVANVITRYFQSQSWALNEDSSSIRAVINRVQAEVPMKYSHLSAGNRIIDQGEIVTPRHVAILQAMKDALNDQRNLWQPSTIARSLILAFLFTTICWIYLSINYPQLAHSNRKLCLVVTVIILTFCIAKITEFFFLTSKSNVIEVIRYPLFVPFSAILLCSLLGPFIATFTSAFLAIVLMMSLAFDSQNFLILNLVASIVAILNARTLRKRKEIFVICGKAWLACIVVIVSFHLYESSNWDGFFTDVFSSAGFMLFTAVLVVGLLPLLESSFHIMTDVTLMEYMDPNHDLLRRLSIEAPGTYQHSVVVGNLAEAAALAIGANGLFCRVATLYHDVGKLATPQYFTENQQGGMNIHQLLTPQESAHVITTHVCEGVALARKAGLPEQFIDIIKEHHGTTLAYYFYRKQLEKESGDKGKVDEKEFCYSGPAPRSKESAIIMIVDSLEAASRSLDKITEETISNLTSRIIREKYEDGQFDHSLLTLEELAIVKKTLVKTLAAYGHARIKYPKRNVGEETLKDDA